MFRVIIADDENRVVKMLVSSIPWTKLGLSVEGTASDGREALRQAKENHADIILTDIRMPGLNGLELCEELHKTIPTYRSFSSADMLISPMPRRQSSWAY